MTSSSPITTQRYLTLPDAFYERIRPAPVRDPSMRLNARVAAEYGLSLDWLSGDHALKELSGNVDAAVPSLAMAYGGHQFGQWVPLLGDGRAHMLGQLTTDAGDTLDVQLKGSGRTRFSRGGDGRATLSAMLREHLIGEAMAGLNIPTTRSLAVINTGEHVLRDAPEPGAISVRLARSHLRVGTFEYARDSLSLSELRALTEFLISDQYASVATVEQPALALLEAVSQRQAKLIAQWMLVGFIHGVMNTDNMALGGETIDYGPCAFMDEFHPQKVFSSIDRFGRYAWGQQPSIALWNLTRFAHAIEPIVSEQTDKSSSTDSTRDVLAQFGPTFEWHFNSGLARKLGLDPQHPAFGDMVSHTLTLLTEQAIDFTQFFTALTRAAHGDAAQLDTYGRGKPLLEWRARWEDLRDTDAAKAMREANPVIIARNHQVENALAAATAGDFTLFDRLNDALATPFASQEAYRDLEQPPRPEQRVTRTFCGT
ncbi:MAG: YdiU family protein [Pseudomonadota bacterium]